MEVNDPSTDSSLVPIIASKVPDERRISDGLCSPVFRDDPGDEFSMVNLAKDLARDAQGGAKASSTAAPSLFHKASFATIEKRIGTNQLSTVTDRSSSGETPLDDQSASSGDAPVDVPIVNGHSVSSSSATTPDNKSVESNESPPSTGSSDGISEYKPGPIPDSFAKFARTCFQLRSSPLYSCTNLQSPLLPPKDKADHLAALASWITILRIMGDIADADHATSLRVAGSTPDVLTTVKVHFGRKYVRKDLEEGHKKYSELFKDPTNTEIKGMPFLADHRESMMEKVQLVCMMGIYRPEIRDELYCQVCKQLTNNPSKNSIARGWVLLYLFSGCFAPSELFLPVFLRFLKEGPGEFAAPCEQLLRRTCTNGTRGYPPGWLEFQAAKNNKPLLLPVLIMTGQRILVKADPTTTINEFCRQVSSKIGLKERSGYSLYITLFRKISCLGHGSHRIMDAVAECEQYTKNMGMRESSATWRLYFRKEFFPPWLEIDNDPIAIDLIYQQIMRGVSVGEYRCEDEIIAKMAAQKYFTEVSPLIDLVKLEKFLSAWLPVHCIERTDKVEWMQQVQTVLESDYFMKKFDIKNLKSAMVLFARDNWNMLFSRCYDLVKLQTGSTVWQGGIVAINYKGCYIMDDADQLKLFIPYWQVTDVTKGRHLVILTTVRGEQHIIMSPHCEDMFTLLTNCMENLHAQSRAAVYNTVTATPIATDSPVPDLLKGDLLLLPRDWKTYTSEASVTGKLHRLNQARTVPKSCLVPLAAHAEPPEDLLNFFDGSYKKEIYLDGTVFKSSIAGKNVYTLEHFAKQHFRKSNGTGMSKLFSSKSSQKQKGAALWKHSSDSLKHPLLRRLQLKQDLYSPSLTAFSAMLQYMGDVLMKEQKEDAELINRSIVEPAIRNRYVRDEIYCQAIKQVTRNPNATSIERGWQLLWLLTGTVTPGSELMQECIKFLKTSTHKLSASCLERLLYIKHEGARHYPPHILEHEAVASKQSTITVYVHFPDQTSEDFEITSIMRVSDLILRVCESLSITNEEEYGLFLSAAGKVISMPEDEYILDYVTFTELYTSKAPPLTRLNLFCMKKLWIHSVPGTSEIDDMKFHFPQEMPNYLRGYHKCSELEASYLAAYIFLSKHGTNHEELDKIGANLDQFLPEDLSSNKTAADWQQIILNRINENMGLSRHEAKIKYLQVVSRWPTYGSVFFEVKMSDWNLISRTIMLQRSSKQYPKDIFLAIGITGVMLINRNSREVLATHSFSRVPNWYYDRQCFTLLIGDNDETPTRLVLETTVGHNIDDLLMSYITWLMNYNMSKKPPVETSVYESAESFC